MNLLRRLIRYIKRDIANHAYEAALFDLDDHQLAHRFPAGPEAIERRRLEDVAMAAGRRVRELQS